MKQHNAFTTREVAIIEKYWPTTMPMSELLAMLSRHTINSITGYANNKLGLKRPTRRNALGSPREQPAWQRVVDFLSNSKPSTQTEIAKAANFARTRASELIQLHRSEVYIASWRWPDGKGKPEAEYTLGNKPDAPRPMGYQRSRRHKQRKVDPFAVAAGLVSAPSAIQGRVFHHLWDDHDREAA